MKSKRPIKISACASIESTKQHGEKLSYRPIAPQTAVPSFHSQTRVCEEEMLHQRLGRVQVRDGLHSFNYALTSQVAVRGGHSTAVVPLKVYFISCTYVESILLTNKPHRRIKTF